MRRVSTPDEDVRILPTAPFLENGNASDYERLCPHRDYRACFVRSLKQRYDVHELQFVPPRGQPAAAAARSMFPRCALNRTLRSGLPTAFDDSFVARALAPAANHVHKPREAGTLAARLQRAARERSTRAHRRLSCDSSASALDAALLIVFGIPSMGTDRLATLRRRAARHTWLQHSAVGHRAVACFLVSAFEAAGPLETLEAEAVAEGDLLFLQAPETPMLVTQPTKYSAHRRLGRGMPTFKQYAFFQHVAALLPAVPFVAKVDDDSLVSLPTLLPLLARLRCLEYALVGAINWAAFVPRARDTGVMGDRCGFAWSRVEALTNFGREQGTGSHRHSPSCAALGAVLPFPYAAGAGYVLSAATLRFLATPLIARWAAEASGARREELQWQKYEDTTTGYWLTFAPQPVHYINVQRWVHNMLCHKQGHLWSKGGGMLRPPTDSTLLVHDLKSAGFSYAWHLVQHGAAKYDHETCLRSLRRARNHGRTGAA